MQVATVAQVQFLARALAYAVDATKKKKKKKLKVECYHNVLVGFLQYYCTRNIPVCHDIRLLYE